MATKIGIWNQALGYVGTRTVASESEKTNEAVQCDLYFDDARRDALRAYPWAFAQTRIALGCVAMPDEYAREWQYAYAYPDGCLKLHSVHQAGDCHGRPPFRIVRAHDGTRMILSGVSAALAGYTIDEPSVSAWDSAFCAVMARKLACLIAVPLLKNNAGKVQELEQLYRMSLPSARSDDASEGKRREAPDAWLTARGGF